MRNIIQAGNAVGRYLDDGTGIFVSFISFGSFFSLIIRENSSLANCRVIFSHPVSLVDHALS